MGCGICRPPFIHNTYICIWNPFYSTCLNVASHVYHTSDGLCVQPFNQKVTYFRRDFIAGSKWRISGPDGMCRLAYVPSLACLPACRLTISACVTLTVLWCFVFGSHSPSRHTLSLAVFNVNGYGHGSPFGCYTSRRDRYSTPHFSHTKSGKYTYSGARICDSGLFGGAPRHSAMPITPGRYGGFVCKRQRFINSENRVKIRRNYLTRKLSGIWIYVRGGGSSRCFMSNGASDLWQQLKFSLIMTRSGRWNRTHVHAYGDLY